MEQIDIYKDLDTNDLENTVEELQHENKKLENHINSLEKGMEVLQNKVSAMRKTQDCLATNISELYKTAKAEIDRKDRTIAELRSQLDDVLFKRKSEKRPLQVSPSEEVPKKIKPSSETNNELYDRQRLDYRRDEHRNREWRGRYRRGYNRNKYTYENDTYRDNRRFTYNSYSNRDVGQTRKFDCFNELSDIESVKLAITDEEDENARNLKESGKFSNKTESSNNNSRKSGYVKEIGEITDEDEIWFDKRCETIKETRLKTDVKKVDEKSKKLVICESDKPKTPKKQNSPKSAKIEKSKLKKITVKEYLDNNKQKLESNNKMETEKKTTINEANQIESKLLENYKIPKKTEKLEKHLKVDNNEKNDRVKILQVVSISPKKNTSYFSDCIESKEKYPEIFQKCRFSPDLCETISENLEAKKRIGKKSKRKSIDSNQDNEASRRVLRSATRKTGQEDVRKTDVQRITDVEENVSEEKKLEKDVSKGESRQTEHVEKMTEKDVFKGELRQTEHVEKKTENGLSKSEFRQIEHVEKKTEKDAFKGEFRQTEHVEKKTEKDVFKGGLRQTGHVEKKTEKDGFKGGLRQTEHIEKKDEQAKIENSVNDKERRENERIVVNLQNIFDDNVMTVNLSHDGAIPVLHFSDRESNDNSLLNLSSYLPPKDPVISTAVTSTPVKALDLLRADLHTSSLEHSSNESTLNFTNSIKSIKQTEDKNNFSDPSMNNLKRTNSVRKRRVCVVRFMD